MAFICLASPKADPGTRVEVPLGRLGGDSTQWGEEVEEVTGHREKPIKGVLMMGYSCGQAGLTLTGEPPRNHIERALELSRQDRKGGVYLPNPILHWLKVVPGH